MGIDVLTRLLSVIDAFLNLATYILIKRPSQCYIQDLDAPADCKNHKILLEGDPGSLEFHPIEALIDLP